MKEKKETKDTPRKFLQSVGMSTWRKLRDEAQERDISIQELIRVEIIPQWLKAKNED